MDRHVADVVPGIGEELIVENRLAAGQGCDFDNIDQLTRLDDAAHMAGIKWLAARFYVGREQGAWAFRQLRVFIYASKGDSNFSHEESVLIKSELVKRSTHFVPIHTNDCAQ